MLDEYLDSEAHENKPADDVQALAEDGSESSPGSPIRSAPFDDLDLDHPEDEEEWERRVMALAATRIGTAPRVRHDARNRLS